MTSRSLCTVGEACESSQSKSYEWSSEKNFCTDCVSAKQRPSRRAMSIAASIAMPNVPKPAQSSPYEKTPFKVFGTSTQLLPASAATLQKKPKQTEHSLTKSWQLFPAQPKRKAGKMFPQTCNLSVAKRNQDEIPRKCTNLPCPTQEESRKRWLKDLVRLSLCRLH